MVQDAAHQLLPSVADLGPLNSVGFGGWGSEIDFRHYLGIRFGILRAKQAVLADDLIRDLRAYRRLCRLHRLNDVVDRHRRRGADLLSNSDGPQQHDQSSIHHPTFPSAHFAPQDPRMHKARSGPKEKQVEEGIVCECRGIVCKLYGRVDYILPTRNNVSYVRLHRMLVASKNLDPPSIITRQPLVIAHSRLRGYGRARSGGCGYGPFSSG